MEGQKKKKTYKPLIRLLIKVTMLVLLIFVVKTWFFDIHIHYGNDSYPMVKDGDLLVIKKFGKSKLGQSDPVLYKAPEGEKVGRIIAYNEDTVDIGEYGIKINESVLMENAVYATEPGNGSYPVKLKPGEYYILNDFRSDMSDSRSYGPISESDVIGKIVFMTRWRGI